VSHVAKFEPDVFANNGLLMCYYCSKSISFENRISVTSHLASKSHKTKHERYLKNNQIDKQ
ncbi:1900_t:CDS:1, partial [Cetraspora pellucida]